jgi:hypothetical protein
MNEITFSRYIRRHGTEGNLYITIPKYDERNHQIEEDMLVEVRISIPEGVNKKKKELRQSE